MRGVLAIDIQRFLIYKTKVCFINKKVVARCTRKGNVVES